jgi:hypothetical protein
MTGLSKLSENEMSQVHFLIYSECDLVFQADRLQYR